MTGFAAIDPLLPPTVDPGEGEHIVVDGSGRRAEGVLYRARVEGFEALWRARCTWELTPAADTRPEGMSVLLVALRRRVGRDYPGPDSACAVTWPSRDREMAATFLRHGLVPSTVLAVRGREAVKPVIRDAVTVRRAGGADVPDLVGLSMAELRYSALVGSAVVRPGAEGYLQAELCHAVRAGEPVWLAESGGVPVGLAVCRRAAPSARLADGAWAQVGAVSVAPAVRGTGVGRALMPHVHKDLLDPTARGTFLFYSPHNALSSVFWHRQGYRPLWTIWEVRPATALGEWGRG